MLLDNIFVSDAVYLDESYGSYAYAEIGPDGVIVNANQLYLEMMGYEPSELVGTKFCSLIDLSNDPGAGQEVWRALNRCEYRVAEFKYIGKRGRDIWAQTTFCPIRGADGTPSRVIALTLDITTPKLVAADHAGQIAAISRAQAVVEFGLNGTILKANANFLRSFGYTLQEVQGRHHRILVDPRDAETADYLAFWEDLARGKFYSGHFKRVAKDGSDVFLYATYNPILDPMGRPWKIAKYAADVTEQVRQRREYDARIAHMAHYDALTGLPNRTLFRERLVQAIAQSSDGDPCAVLYVDLDHFKLVNDTLGHPVGDSLLRAATARLFRNIRDVDTIARLGGDEFAIVQPSGNQPCDAIALASRLIEQLSGPFQIDEHKITIGATVGIAVAPQDARDPEQIQKCADLALYSAKSNGRGRYCCFEPDMDRRAQKRRQQKIKLRHALDNEHFELVYQPWISTRTRQLKGFEALLRWRDTTCGLILPKEFLPLAEEIGLSVTLGSWVIRNACKAAARWPSDVRLAVNVSPSQVAAAGFLEMVVSALEECNLDPKRLELDITEAAILEKTAHTRDTLEKLRGFGISIALDDFGTGYSSLNHLRSFSIDRVKIDRSFIKELGQKREVDAIVSATINLCNALGIVSSAEGVETEMQLDILNQISCCEAQGNLVGEPMPSSAVSSYRSNLLCLTQGGSPDVR